MAKESQYTDAYLKENRRRGRGKGLTIGSFLAYQLQGKAREYAGKYAAALEASVIRRGAVVGKSVQGGVAYYPPEVSK